MGPRICRSLQEAERGIPRALSIGNFDGVHAGHRRILRRVAELAREQGWRPSAMTFEPHPAVVVAPERAPRLLTTLEQRARLIAEQGIEEVLIVPFHPEFSRLTPRQFVHEVLVETLSVRAVQVGANFRFGYQHGGDIHTLAQLGEEFGFLTGVVPDVVLRGIRVSSSRIRSLLEVGEVSRAGRLLERAYWIEGDIVPGRRVGSAKTVPTLNLEPPAGVVLPADGVYITRTFDWESDRRWPSVTNIGYRPTFGGRALTIETHLLSPLEGGDPGRIRVEFLLRLREERKFPDAAALRAQILRDVARARRYFRLRERLLYSKSTPV
ncbi:MAG: bifunctional riboflavin kinase/FAD synthetase [Bryobacteraceae bacterium]|nr:bifunctional riboflavin kinase/FAD synthetase [Bryobacteraceae bacterium]